MVIGERTRPARKRGCGGSAGRALPWMLAALMVVLLPILALEPARCDVVIAVTPTRIPLRLAPEDTMTGEVTLINQGTEEARLQPRVMTLTEGTGGELVFEQDGTCSWLSPENKVLRLMPAESGTFAFSATVPAGTTAGSYRFALTFELSREEGKGIGLTGGVAVLIDLEVLPRENAASGGFPVALTIALAVLAALLIGLLAIVAALRLRGRDEAGRAGATGGDGQ